MCVTRTFRARDSHYRIYFHSWTTQDDRVVVTQLHDEEGTCNVTVSILPNQPQRNYPKNRNQTTNQQVAKLKPLRDKYYNHEPSLKAEQSRVEAHMAPLNKPSSYPSFTISYPPLQCIACGELRRCRSRISARTSGSIPRGAFALLLPSLSLLLLRQTQADSLHYHHLLQIDNSLSCSALSTSRSR